jgi:outer membrane protein insertion porin family
VGARLRLRFFVFVMVLVGALVGAPWWPVSAARAASSFDVGDYEGRPVEAVEVVIEGATNDATAQAEFASLITVGREYSAVRVRESLDALFLSGRVANARVEIIEGSGPATSTAGAAANATRPLRLRFVVKRQVLVRDVVLELIPPTGTTLSTDELRGRLNMLEPGARVSEQTLRRNADLIQEYLRDRGFFRADVDFAQQLDASGTRATITFRVTPNEEARVAAFNIQVQGFDAARVRPVLKLQAGAPFSRSTLGEDIGRLRQEIISLGYLAPQLDDPQVSLDSASNMVTINLAGGVGPKVSVQVNGYELKEKAEKELLPVRREGNIDLSAIEEGRRRLNNKLQEEGYFFADVTYTCSVDGRAPAATATTATAAAVATPAATDAGANGSLQMCENLNASELSGHTVGIVYNVERGRRFKLTDIRIEGTDKLKYEDVQDELRTEEASALGFIPLLGYGRGYTSLALLAQDQNTIKKRMQDLGYRRANVTVRQGVSIAGENLIITFAVTEGQLTRIAGTDIRGNQIYTESRLRQELEAAGHTRCDARQEITTPCFITREGEPFSRSQARADGEQLLNLYARNGYVDAQLDFSILELPKQGDEERVRLIYTIKQEGDKVFINNIVINGVTGSADTQSNKRKAIMETISLKEGDVLRADRINESERLLYQTDAFRQVIITTEAAGETASGFKKRDVMIDVEELKPRDRTIGGGFSTDNGPLGIFEIRNVNMFGKLQQGAFRIRASRNQQIVRIEYSNPRFQRYGERQFAPLTLSLQYTRDSTVTRFFRSTIDKGNFGIVQRLDQAGKPIDVNCTNADETKCRVGTPTINRFTFNAETTRVLDQKSRSAIFLRYSYEDVRLFNIGSLLIADILRPDKAIRLSRLGVTFVRDTRDSQFDATRGEFFNIDYGLALSQLGGSISFNKLQTSYRRYQRLSILRGTVLAGNFTLGVANLFNPRDRNGNGVIDDVDRTLPISERFFSGGSTTIRGFGYEEAGPREVAPSCFAQTTIDFNCGLVRDKQGKLIRLNPFLVPIGGNAEAIANLEARVQLTKLFQVVPFYDGGNVFRHASDIFRKGGQSSDPNLTAIERVNLRAQWTHTVGLGFRIKTPIGGSLAIDYGFLLNPPAFLLPQRMDGPATIRPKSSQIHFRFTQTF